MPVQFIGGPLDGVKEHASLGAEKPYWVMQGVKPSDGVENRHAIYRRCELPDGSKCYKFERWCDSAEAAVLMEELKKLN